MSSTLDRTKLRVQDLVLQIGTNVDRKRWDEDRYEPFLDELCQDREYQKEAIRTALRYVLSGQYRDLRSLAHENWETNDSIQERYGTRSNFEAHLQLPDLLSASIDLATGTGKSYVIYGVAAILLAEQIVDRVLVLCPSTTIESGLLAKFKLLAGKRDLSDALPADVQLRRPRIIQATETIVKGSICVENRDAVYAHVKSSIRDSLWGKGVRVAVLNDEAHHVANEPDQKTKKWKQFLSNPDYGFRIVLGFSGTCYVGNDYFADVIYRYSLRRAMEEQWVKKVRYLTEIERVGEEGEEWQLRINMHESLRKDLKKKDVRPLTIAITQNIKRCKAVAEDLRAYLREHAGYSADDVEKKVLVVYNNAPDVPKLHSVDEAKSPVEWIVSVSMLNEGWDVKRVFQIVPHEERAFNSKLLIAQVLGRGLRDPERWTGPQPVATVFNHAAWAPSIRHLVDEVLEQEKAITARPIAGSPYHFDLHNLHYDVVKRSEVKPAKGPMNLLAKGTVNLPTESENVRVKAEFEQAATGARDPWQTTVRRKTYTPEELASDMHNRLVAHDMECSSSPDPKDRTSYAKDWPYDVLLNIVRKSLHRQGYATENQRQRLLQAVGTIWRRATTVVRYDMNAGQMYVVSTKNRPEESASAAQLRRDRVAFIPRDTRDAIDEEQLEFFDEVVEEGGPYRHVSVKNRMDLKTPMYMVYTDAGNEKRFVESLLDSSNRGALDAWVKSDSMRFYSIDYAWRKGQHPKRGKFNPDFFLKKGDTVLAVEIKGNEELKDPKPESAKKYEYACAHFKRLNAELARRKNKRRYRFHFLALSDFPDFFDSLRKGQISSYVSKLDVKLEEQQGEG